MEMYTGHVEKFTRYSFCRKTFYQYCPNISPNTIYELLLTSLTTRFAIILLTFTFNQSRCCVWRIGKRLVTELQGNCAALDPPPLLLSYYPGRRSAENARLWTRCFKLRFAGERKAGRRRVLISDRNPPHQSPGKRRQHYDCLNEAIFSAPLNLLGCVSRRSGRNAAQAFIALTQTSGPSCHLSGHRDLSL